MPNILDPTDTAANARMQKTVQDAMVVQDSTPLGATNEPPANTNARTGSYMCSFKKRS